MREPDEFVQGYLDGRDPNTPEPSANRSNAYRHSWQVGRAEIENRPPPFGSFQATLDHAALAEEKDAAR